MKKKKVDRRAFYVVTGISRLSEQREEISLPCSLENVKIVYDKFMQSPKPRAYTYPRIELHQAKIFK